MSAAMVLSDHEQERPPDKRSLQTLRGRLHEVLNANQTGLSPASFYLPDDEYDELFTRNTVQNALGGGNTNAMLVKYVLEDAKRTFATLIRVFSYPEELQKAVNALKIAGFKDEKLASNTLNLCHSKLHDKACAHPFLEGEPWDTTSFDIFKQQRWQFLVPKFETEIFLYEFDKHQLLPFTESALCSEMPGGHFSDVIGVEMLASKQDKNSTRDSTITVALKTLKRISDDGYDIEAEWRREAKAYKQLNGKSTHLIQAFAAYCQREENPRNNTYHLVLEWADGGNLLTFWSSNREPQVHNANTEKSRRHIMDMLEQFYGLADALEGMHNTSSHPAEDSRRSSIQSSPGVSPERDIQRRVDRLEASTPLMESSPLPTLNIEGVHDARLNSGDAAVVSIFPPDSANIDAILPLHTARRNTGLNSENWRHGDIKPENILRFKRGGAETDLGTLKLADLGRAQQHAFVTKMRESQEKEPWRTRLYEPPDLEDQDHVRAQQQISRLFDIWSIGCVIFEAVLWSLHGFESLEAFWNDNSLPPGGQGGTPYWRKRATGEYEVSDAAMGWMNQVIEHDPERDGAVGDLVKLVRDRLLKIRRPEDSDVYTDGCRTNAKDLKKQLSSIIAKAKDNSAYLFSGADRPKVPLSKFSEPNANGSQQSTGYSSWSPVKRNRISPSVTRGWGTAIAQQREYTNRIEDKWKTSPENDFIESNLAGRHFSSRAPDKCPGCSNMDPSLPQISFNMDTLKANSDGEECDLCELVYAVAEDLNLTGHECIRLNRSGSYFVFDGKLKALRICCTTRETKWDTAIEIGAPALLSPGNRDPSFRDLASFVKLPKTWLAKCDIEHGDVCAIRYTKQALPTRLVNIENPKKPRIVITTDLLLDPKKTKYVALSHKWGDMPNKALTTKQNIEQRTKRILTSELPLNFKNAIAITRALDCTYLWIDSLCILQGPDGDFDRQADKMQEVFSGAYFIMAACSAKNATDGFLQERKPQYVKMGEVFISAVTNDFERHVLNSPLSRRGWVLQERALARRTIFFTKTQMYWECGDGIRCEALAKMKNDMVAFLGDANFPSYTIGPKRTAGEQIELFLGLFQDYTRLEFSHPEDRPFAIDGLMQRLNGTLKTKSLAGLFESFWGRCLLWQRADGAGPLKKIVYKDQTRKAPPTWSWMAFEGAISFIKPKGGGVNWNDDVNLPFSDATQTSWLKTSHRSDSTAIKAEAYDFKTAEDADESAVFLSYDNGKVPTTSVSTKCVIIGSDKEEFSDADERKYYVLIVKAVSGAHGTILYERAGVGYLLEKCILFDDPHPSVEIR
ncbi:MAG: hypothetical protein M1822_005924 [Bathelium mastoideum]|nr:MAG: hypothetical protein M1822_005924 [Bathelium mastoideum]